MDHLRFDSLVAEAADMEDAQVPMDTRGLLPPEQRLPGAMDAARTVLIDGEVVLTAMVHRFGSHDEAQASVESFARVLFSYEKARQLTRLDLTALAPDARGAVASGLDEGPGGLVMSAWSRGADRFDLSVSVLREGVTAQDFWDHFPRATYDRVAAAMMRAIS